MPSTHTADFQTAALKAIDLEAVEKVNVGLETELVKKHVNIIADAPEIRIQDKIGSAPEVNATTMAIVADGGTTHFRAGTTTFAEGTDTKGNVKFQSSTGATTHAEIVGSSGTLELQDGGLGLKLGSNVSVSGTPSAVIQEITGPHARESAVLKKYPEVVFAEGKFDYNHESNTYTQGGYTGSTSSKFSLSGAYKALDGTHGTAWISELRYDTSDGSPLSSAVTTTYDTLSTAIGEWIQLQFPKRMKLSHSYIGPQTEGGYSTYGAPRTPKSLIILGSNDGTNWVSVFSGSGYSSSYFAANTLTSVGDITNNTYYKFYRMVVTSVQGGSNGNYVSISEWELYGYEEVGAGDDSVDTTVKSVYNAPDLTSAALYIDGKKSGSTPTDYGGSSVTVTDNGTWDSSDNTWSLSGTTTSNVVSGNLASLVGDHPHSVSAWVKADVLNGDGLFHVGTADGEGDAASRVGFVDDSHISYGGEDHFFSNAEWHNVTYTYNGEGSDKKLYIDGRHIGTAKNEDTFGDYPPFAMSTYSEYGYAVSASSSHPNYPPHYAFNDSTTHGTSVNIWITDNGMYNASGVGTPTSSADTTVVDGTNQVGEWLQIELPHQLKVSYMDIAPQGQNAGTLDRAPKDGIIAGSRDGSTWETMKSWTGVTDWALDGTSGVFKTFVIDTNTDKAYKYIRIIITKTGGNDAYGALSEVKIFGHRENDLVRFPDSGNELRYPHVAMINVAQRGYVVTSASNTDTGGTAIEWDAANAYRAFDNNTDTYYFGLYDSGTTSPYVTSTGYWDTTNYPNLKLSSASGTPAGDWVSIELPRKLTLKRIELASRGVGAMSWSIGESARDFEIWATNDNSSWTRIHQTTNATAPTAIPEIRSFDVNATVAYKRFALIVTRNGSTYPSSTGRPVITLSVFNLYGTEPEDVVARVGDGFDGKVRNLRVYSTALSDARVQEIFDADKDEFGLAKSSVSVYRGHLGVGTDKPKGALTVMDEVGELIQLPPGNMTAHDQYFEKHGLFKARTSPGHNTVLYPPWEGFNDTIGTLWYTGYSDSSASYNGTGGTYSGTAQLGATTKLGEYLVLEMPYKVFPKRMEYIRQSGGSHLITTAYVYGRNGSNGIWTEIGSFTDAPPTKDWVPKVVHLNNSEAYDQLAFVPTKRYAASATAGVSCHLVRYFGTREQGASTLHNGELSLTRNLTVPRIGPPLDTDDTPRRDRLVVEYNTSTNPTENGVVKDTSGHGWDANFYGSSAYDASEKAITLSDGTDDYLETGKIINGYSGDIDHTFALWVKPSKLDMVSGNHYLAVLGSETAQNKWCAISISAKHLSHIVHSSIEIASDTELVPETWQHIAISYTSGGSIHSNVHMDYYINGEKYTGSFTSGGSNYGSTSYTIDLVGPLSVRIGSLHNGSEDAASSISNFKLYDVALTADEVRRLYDMGRCDEGHHVVNFSKTRVGIGLGDGEVSDALLNVGGIPYGPGATPRFFVKSNVTTLTTAAGTVRFNYAPIDSHNGFDPSTYTYTVQVAGVYKLHGDILMRQTNGGAYTAGARIEIRINGSQVFSSYGAGRDRTEITVAVQGIYYCNVGDTINMYHTNISYGDIYISNTYQGFSGFLLC